MKLSDIQEGTIITEEIEKQLTSESKKTVEKSTDKNEKNQKSVEVIEARKEKTLTNKYNFKITPLMKVWIDTAIELISTSPSEISPKCGIDRGTYYKWTKLAGFNDWFLEEWKAQRKQWIPQLDRMGMERARKSFDYWKAMNQKAGDLLDNEKNVGITGQNVVAILGGMTINNVKQDLTGKNDKDIYGYDKQKEEGERPDKL